MSHTPPRNAQEAIAQANRYDRARQIIKEGYSFTFDALTNMVAVCKPNELHASYFIGEQVDGTDGCSCPDRAKTGLPCKHELAWDILQTEAQQTLTLDEETASLEAQCAEFEAERARLQTGLIPELLPAPFDVPTATPSQTLQQMRTLLLAELLAAENRAMQLHHEPFCEQSAVRSWLNKADRCKKALQQFDETLAKLQTGLLTL